MEQIVTCLLMVQKFINLRQNILKLWQLHYAEEIFLKTGQLIISKNVLNGYVYDFSVDYDATHVDDIVDIHNYLIKK